jgi:serine/threonine protein kinase
MGGCDGLTPLLADFGLTSHVATETATGCAGTIRWQAPELLESEDARRSLASDMYSFGCLCLEVRHR